MGLGSNKTYFNQLFVRNCQISLGGTVFALNSKERKETPSKPKLIDQVLYEFTFMLEHIKLVASTMYLIHLTLFCIFCQLFNFFYM